GYVNGYTVTASAGSGGSITPSGESIVAEGDDIKYTLSPRSSYAVSHILLDGERVNVSGRTYTLTDVRDNHTVQAVFKYVGGGGYNPPSGGDDTPPVASELIVTPKPVTFYVGDDIRDKITVQVRYSDGSTKSISSSSCEYSPGYTLTASGNNKVTVEYDDLKTTIEINVSEDGSKTASVLVTEHQGQSKSEALGSYSSLGTYISQPGDVETFKIRISDTYGSGFVYGLRFHTLSGDTGLAGRIEVSVDGSEPVKLSSLVSDSPIRLDNSLGNREFTVILSFPHSSDNNDAMGMSMKFTLEVGVYESSAFEGGSA
ncbi:MAG: bacterial Ig-like domain-containing protein, partial [Candidatus Methanomethylophilaceae archaeon]|nr:bacterial Ig-like domain-containing protein [Candidatus Methanomethylophilaceae archaeon]